MGSAVGAALVSAGVDVVWLPQGRSEATRRRAEAAGLVEAASVTGCDVVLSVCPPAAAIDTARSVVGFAGVYVDANAVSPPTAQAVADVVTAGGATFVDGGIIGPPPTKRGTTRLYLSGQRSLAVAELYEGTTVDARVLESPQSASALKMAYASWTKVSAALLLAAHGTAGALGVADALEAEWALSQPDLPERLAAAARSADRKGWRWEAEMREVAETFDAAGWPAGFGEAAAEVFGRSDRP